MTEALLEAAGSVEQVLKTPAPRVHFAGFGDSSLDFEIRVWINEPHKHPQIRSKINFAINAAFRKHNIESPVPQRDVRLRSSPVTIQAHSVGFDNPEVKHEEDGP